MRSNRCSSSATYETGAPGFVRPSLRFGEPPADAMERRRRLALLLAVRELRCSVCWGRPLSLPNVIRLFRRRWAAIRCRDQTQEQVDSGVNRAVMRLQAMYFRHQPFRARRIAANENFRSDR